MLLISDYCEIDYNILILLCNDIIDIIIFSVSQNSSNLTDLWKRDEHLASIEIGIQTLIFAMALVGELRLEHVLLSGYKKQNKT